MPEEGWVWYRTALAKPAPHVLWKEPQWASPFPPALRCRIREPDSHLLIRQFWAFKEGAGWHIHRSLKGRNLQVVHSSSWAILLQHRPPLSCGWWLPSHLIWLETGSLNPEDSAGKSRCVVVVVVYIVLQTASVFTLKSLWSGKRILPIYDFKLK